MAEAPLKERKRADRSSGSLGKLEREVPPPGTPLGVRYSLIMAGPGGIDMEVDPITPLGKDDAPRLAVQTNENGYLSVLFTRQPSDKPTILFPSSGEGQVTGLNTIAIPLARIFEETQSIEQIRMHVYFSRTPHHITMIPLSTDRNMPHLLIEQVDPSQPGMPTEQAVYAVNPNPDPAASVSVDIPLSLHP